MSPAAKIAMCGPHSPGRGWAFLLQGARADLMRPREQRIVSLIPSGTEIVCALGLEEQLVGRSHSCDFPPSVRGLPALTEPKVDAEAASLEIDRSIVRLVEQGLSVYRVDAERLRELAPTDVVTQDQCEVCAATLSDVEAALRTWTGRAPQLLSLRPSGLSEVWENIVEVARFLGVEERGGELRESLEAHVAELGKRTSALPGKPRVACLEWLDPLMAAGNWVPELVRIAGGENLFGEEGVHSGRLAWNQLVDADPDVIVLMPCGFDSIQTRRELGVLRARSEWPELRSVREGKVYITDGHQYFNRPGPRLADSAQILAEIFHPEHLERSSAESAWEPL